MTYTILVTYMLLKFNDPSVLLGAACKALSFAVFIKYLPAPQNAIHACTLIHDISVMQAI